MYMYVCVCVCVYAHTHTHTHTTHRLRGDSTEAESSNLFIAVVFKNDFADVSHGLLILVEATQGVK
jgi:hypothetical protein